VRPRYWGSYKAVTFKERTMTRERCETVMSLKKQIEKIGGPRFGEDLFGDLCVKVYSPGFPWPCADTYILAVARNAFLSLLRYERVRSHESLGVDIAGCDDGELRTQLDTLSAAMRQLEARDQDVLEAKYSRGESDRQTALRMHTATSTVRTQRRRAILRLRDVYSMRERSSDCLNDHGPIRAHEGWDKQSPASPKVVA
jgi:RNA polymerase sigma factor (sigma-70 family)